MNSEPIEIEAAATSAPRGLNPLWILLAALLLLVFGLLGYLLGLRQAARPAERSAEAGFARDMINHHAQGVDLATLARDRSSDPALRQAALDMILTQQAQIGQMQGWLAVWGLPIASTGPAMAWMDAPGEMPGMATAEQVNLLRDLSGPDAEVLFLRLMIAHHRGGVAMAQGLLERANLPVVRAMAQSIIDAQTSEIDMMQEMLQQRGQPPEPEPEGAGGMDMHSP